MKATELFGLVGTLIGLAQARGVLVDGKLQNLSMGQWVIFATEVLTTLQKSGVTFDDLVAIVQAAGNLAPLFGFKLPQDND